MSAPETAEDRRRSPRNRTFVGGQLIFNQRRSTLDCTVRNLSETGAMVRLSDTVTLPEIVELYLPVKRESHMARIRWRDRESSGLEFIRETTPVSQPESLDLMRRIKQLEQENAQLRARIEQLTEGSI